ncbi:MAG: hypothetical protein KC503_23100 [Myxococcales bacterium]|nr:hypothetical protein [Myxococcales bacterium]
MTFRAPRDVFNAIDPARFAALERFAAVDLAHVDLTAEAAELGLDLAACRAAVADQAPFAGEADAVFVPFEGEWLGSDIHDSTRAYRHIWLPTEVDTQARFAGQKVLMLPLAAGRAPTYAYDFCELGDAATGAGFRITGLVDDRAHRGYALPGGALLWLGEERDGQISLHLERVHAAGQLYDIRGAVVMPGDPPQLRARSDWRYHRLRPGAVVAP